MAVTQLRYVSSCFTNSTIATLYHFMAYAWVHAIIKLWLCVIHCGPVWSGIVRLDGCSTTRAASHIYSMCVCIQMPVCSDQTNHKSWCVYNIISTKLNGPAGFTHCGNWKTCMKLLTKSHCMTQSNTHNNTQHTPNAHICTKLIAPYYAYTAIIPL